jgi:hypothetical protein
MIGFQCLSQTCEMKTSANPNSQRTNPLRALIWGGTFVLTAFFILLWASSAWLFRKAAREQAPPPPA